MSVKASVAMGMIAVAVSAGAACAADRFQPGQWELVFTGERSNTIKVCVNAATVQGLNGSAESVRADTDKIATAQRMSVQAYAFDGVTLAFTAVGAGQTVVTTASYRGDSFDKQIVTKTPGANDVTSRETGRRLGDCP
jgi:hypothetical protein